ncbi:MAG: TIGR02221 family CRISPR-associated protein [Candidatus Poribacteria bacterium]|nr:TIGR02221 family CRISPR-associated protein [Candidatus Poribacteria bacterium]
MAKTCHASVGKEHILLTSLGMRAIKTEYLWNGKKAEADLTPLALVELLEKSQLPNRVVAVVTQDAKRETWQIFRAGICRTLRLSPELVEIPNGSSTDEIRQILETVANRVPEGADLTLDVTQGLRHFPFIFYALVLYLKSLRGVNIRGAYYGMVEGIAKEEPKPIIDLQPLLELPEWFHAVRMFRDQGTTNPMASLLQPLANQLREQGSKLQNGAKKPPLEAIELYKKSNQVKGAVDSLKNYAFAYESALPLELEKASRGLVASIEKLPATDSQSLPPLVGELTESIVSAAQKTAFIKLPAKKGKWKEEIPLDENELKRQAYMIDLYLKRDQLSLAVGLMREWVISWAIWKSSKTVEIEKWLDNNKVRPRYERILGAIGASAKSGGPRLILTQDQEEFREFWNRLTDNLRNALHHHAMRSEALEEVPISLKDVQKFWNQLKDDGLKTTSEIELPPLGGRLLISPQGRRPGVLFSALKVADPDTCLVICSDTSADSTRDAADEAGFRGAIEQIKLDDPLGGFNEIEKVAQHAKGYLSYADEVRANITGGTTLMGVIVQKLVEEAQQLNRPVKRFALIDRRSTEEQESDPFVQGDSHWLD